MFITSGVLSDVIVDTIRDIIQASHFQYVIVITAVSPSVHLYSRTGSMEGDETAVFERVEDKILEWMGNMVLFLKFIEISYMMETYLYKLQCITYQVTVRTC